MSSSRFLIVTLGIVTCLLAFPLLSVAQVTAPPADVPAADTAEAAAEDVDPFAVPDGTTGELMQWLQELLRRQPEVTSQAEMDEYRKKIFKAIIEATSKVLAGKPKLDLMRSAARKDGMKSFQEEGILLVAKGTTSLPELMRVLKQ